MEYALRKFLARIDFIHRQINTQSKAQSFITTRRREDLPPDEVNMLEDIISNRTDAKIYQYTANIISLYGGLECFVEEEIEEYLKELFGLFPSYRQMVETTQINEYLLCGINLINHAEERKFKALPKGEVLKSLYETVVADKSSSIKSEAYMDFGGGNYRHEAIMRCFSNLGVKEIGNKLKRFDPLNSYITKEGAGTSEAAVFTKVDDLVERRNELAHGGDNIEMLDTTLFEEYLSFFAIYAETINLYLVNEISGYRWAINTNSEIEPRVFSHNVIQLQHDVTPVGAEFKKGQTLSILRDGFYFDGVVANIRVGDDDYERYRKEDEGIEIGLRIDASCTITKGCKAKFY